MGNIKDLVYEIDNFGAGLSNIEESINEFINKEERELIERVINGEIGEGIVKEKYMRIFNYSLEDELSEFGYFLDEICDAENISFVSNFYSYSDDSSYEGNNIERLFYGLNLAEESLSNILHLCKDKSLNNFLLNFVSSSGSNIFKENGIEGLYEKFLDFSNAFKNEINKHR